MCFLGKTGQLGPTSERPSCDGSRELGRSLASPSILNSVDRPVAWGVDLCLVVVFERSVGRLGKGSGGHHDWRHSEFSQDECSENITLLVLQISQTTSFVLTTQLSHLQISLFKIVTLKILNVLQPS